MGRYISIGMLDVVTSVSRERSDVVKELDSRDDWVVNDREVLKKINTLFKNLDKLVNSDDRCKDAVIKIMSMVNTGSMISLSDFVKNKNEYYYFTELLKEINKGDSENSRLIIRRFLTLYRVSVIPRIFSDERLERIHEQIKTKNLNNK